MTRPANRLLATASRLSPALAPRQAIRSLATTAPRRADSDSSKDNDAAAAAAAVPDSSKMTAFDKLTTRSAYNPANAPPPTGFTPPSAAATTPGLAPNARSSASRGGGMTQLQYILGHHPNAPAADPSAPAPLWNRLMNTVGGNAPVKGPYDPADVAASGMNAEELAAGGEPFHFHVLATKHNCHVTVTRPNRNAIISMSCGNLGFRKSKRGTYDAAYQLTAYVIDKLNQGGWHRSIGTLEVVLRGFGPGREAATKILMGTEGKFLRPKIVKLSDATRLKFGGTRSPAPRRLG